MTRSILQIVNARRQSGKRIIKDGDSDLGQVDSAFHSMLSCT